MCDNTDESQDFVLGEEYSFGSDCTTITLDEPGECITDVDPFYKKLDGIEGIKYTTNKGNVGAVGTKGTNPDFYTYYNTLDYEMVATATCTNDDSVEDSQGEICSPYYEQYP
jgi:hypothetical protein